MAPRLAAVTEAAPMVQMSSLGSTETQARVSTSAVAPSTIGFRTIAPKGAGSALSTDTELGEFSEITSKVSSLLAKSHRYGGLHGPVNTVPTGNIWVAPSTMMRTMLGEATTWVWIKIGVTYVVPLVVSNLGLLVGLRREPG